MLQSYIIARKCDIISEIYHPFRQERISLKNPLLSGGQKRVFRGGSGWIRTTEVVDNRFTVCPLWPLGNTPTSKILNFQHKKLELVDGLEPPTC